MRIAAVALALLVLSVAAHAASQPKLSDQDSVLVALVEQRQYVKELHAENTELREKLQTAELRRSGQEKLSLLLFCGLLILMVIVGFHVSNRFKAYVKSHRSSSRGRYETVPRSQVAGDFGGNGNGQAPQNPPSQPSSQGPDRPPGLGGRTVGFQPGSRSQ